MPLNVVPGTGWQAVRGQHPGGLVIIQNVTDRSVYYRVIREGAGTGPRARQGGPKTRLDLDTFLRNYRPNSKRDWQIATTPMGPPAEIEGENHVTTPQADNGRLHPEEEAIADAIRSGTKFHEVQAQFHVQGKVLAEIIKKFDVPYETVRERDAAKVAPAPGVPDVDVPDGPLHPNEDEIVEVMRSRAAGFHEVLRTYGVKGVTLAQIMARHGIPKQTVEERKAKERAAYQARKAREEAARAETAAAPSIDAIVERLVDKAAEAAREAAMVASAPAEASTALVATEPIVAPSVQPEAGRHGWHVTIRTEVHLNVQAATYLEAGQAALAATPEGAEIISLVRIEGGAA